MHVLVRQQIDAQQPLEITFQRLSVQMRQLFVRDKVLSLVEVASSKVYASAGDGVERGWLAESFADNRRLRHETRSQTEAIGDKFCRGQRNGGGCRYIAIQHWRLGEQRTTDCAVTSWINGNLATNCDERVAGAEERASGDALPLRADDGWISDGCSLSRR